MFRFFKFCHNYNYHELPIAQSWNLLWECLCGHHICPSFGLAPLAPQSCSRDVGFPWVDMDESLGRWISVVTYGFNISQHVNIGFDPNKCGFPFEGLIEKLCVFLFSLLRQDFNCAFRGGCEAGILAGYIWWGCNKECYGLGLNMWYIPQSLPVNMEHARWNFGIP
jgi:hypothetical protein